MSKSFRPWRIDETQLLPASVQDFVGKDHLARLVVSLVREQLSLAEISASYSGEKGQPPYHPAMMTALLLYSYCSGVYSSRRIAKGCRERTDFLLIVALDPPDFRTVSEFRRRHLAALSGLFTQVLRLCEKAGLVKLGHVALDGTKIQANASKHKAMSYRRMREAEAKLAAEVAAWFARAAAADAEEDRAHGPDRRGDEMPAWVVNKQARLERLRAAKAPPPEDGAEPGPSTGMMNSGRPQRAPDGGPPDKAQRNFTDPDSRLQPTKGSFIQGYNAQAAV